MQQLLGAVTVFVVAEGRGSGGGGAGTKILLIFPRGVSDSFTLCFSIKGTSEPHPGFVVTRVPL